MQHAMVLLVAYSTMRGTELHSMKRSEIAFDDEGMNIVVLKKKAKNRG
jgi:integrase